MASLKFSLLFISTLFLITTPLPSLSLSFSQCQTLFSLAPALSLRVSNLRASRGDVAGASRARFIAEKIRPALGLGFWRYTGSLAWDYLRNESWRDTATFFEVLGTVSDLYELMRAVDELMRVDSGAERNYGRVLGISKSLFGRLSKLFYQPGMVSGTVSDLNELMRAVDELMRVNSGAERAAWVQRNYGRVLGISKSLFGRLSKLFYQPGPLREVVLMLQREVVEGELLRDCLELASDDLKGLIQIVKDIALQFSSMPNRNEL